MLLIEKVVKLLDDFHYQTFRTYLKNLSVRSYYPMVLFDVINQNPETEQTTERLIKSVYGEEEEEQDEAKIRKKFLQLASYTFKLTGYLAKNYPDYLQHNITKIQRHINYGELDKATCLANMLLEVSQKTEDYDTELKVLNILIQREVLLESAKKSEEYHARTREVLRYKQEMNEIMSVYNKHIRVKAKVDSKTTADDYIGVFEQYHDSKSFGVSVISRFFTYNTFYYFRDERFFSEDTWQGLTEIEKRLEKYDYVILPYLFTLNQRIPYLKLSLKLSEWTPEEILAESDKIISGSAQNLYWNSFPNIPEIMTLGIQLSHYINNYFYSYREDKEEFVPDEIIADFRRLQEECQGLLLNKELENRFKIRYITLQYIYAGFLILDEPEKIQQAVRNLESLLISYQQTPFHKFIDSLFSLLIVAYFCEKKYDRLEDAYRRYKKAITGKVVNPENDLTINGFFYAAKWNDTQRKQYAKKMSAIIDEIVKAKYKGAEKMLREVADYYDIPIVG